MAWVRIRHPATGGEAEVDERSLGHWAGCGWVAAEQGVAPEPEAAAEDDTTVPDDLSGGGEPASQETSPDQQEEE